VIYPGLKSIRAIETKETGDDKVWLTYWMVFGLLTVAETFFGFIFFFVPYYAWIRVGFFVWLIEFNGA
jgi:receptor expression-enhancing protein 5/6